MRTPRFVALALLLALCGCDSSASSDDPIGVGPDTGVSPRDVADGVADAPGDVGEDSGEDAVDDVGEDAVVDTDLGAMDVSDTTRVDADASAPDSSELDEVEPPVDLCAGQDAAAPVPAARTAINRDPAFIQVYVNNIENLKTAGEQCRGDWTDLIHYMKTVQPSPDLFLVQQISDRAQLDLLVERMTDQLPGAFAGVIAEANPDPQLSPCGKEKALQTNAIIYRTGRFEAVDSKHVWQSWANKNDVCVRNHQARTKNVMIKLRDKISGKTVTAASLHWSTAQGGGPDPACALKNMREADQKMQRAGFEADLVVVGGDLNEPDRNAGGSFRAWHRAANGDRGGELNYRDVIYRMCQSRPNLQTCLDNNWTIGSSRRIDFLFAKDGNGCRAGVRRAHTVSFDEADAAAREITGGDSSLNYSDHRAVRAELYY